MADEPLAAVRDGILDVHRELLQHQRVDVERIYGRMSAGDLLQATISDLRFAWLRPLSELATEIDALLGDAARRGDANARDELLERARGLVAPPDPDTAFGARYVDALQREPGVGVAHGRLATLLR
jgi:hypothetical protein